MAEIEEFDVSDVAAAVSRGRAAQREWSRQPASARADALNSAADRVAEHATDLIDLGVREVGKPRSEMAAELKRGVAILRYYAQQALEPHGTLLPAPTGRGLLLTQRHPHGVVGLITPWNFPVAIPLWKAAPALAFGNAVALKPAPDAVATARSLVEILDGALPADLVQFVPGDAHAGSALIANVDAVSFTGSVPVGRTVARSAVERGVPVQAEMGGQNASIIFPDANLDYAATCVAYAAMGYAGQKCTATSRVIIVGDPRPFTEALVAAVSRLPVGDPADEATVVGPVIDETALHEVLTAVEAAKASGGRLLTGGKAVDAKRNLVEPTLMAEVAPDHAVAQREVFGPFAVILPARDDSEAIAIANNVRYGLTNAIFTSDLDRVLRWTSQLQSGMCRVNTPTTGVDYYAPFGGIKDSSFGPREQGKAAQDFYTWTQTVTIDQRPSG